MSNFGFELNKIVAAVLVAGLIAMVAATVSDVLYSGGHHEAEVKRGYFVEVAEAADAGASGGAEAAPVNIPALLAAASVDAGKTVAKKCAACHSFEKGGANKVGPNLWNVVNGPKAHVAGFAYSKVLAEAGAGGGKWDYESLYKFLEKPSKYLPGTKMSFAGLKKPEENAAVIAYLRSLSDAPAPLPAQ